MILSDGELLEVGSNLIDPFDPARVQPASIDVLLGDEFDIPDLAHSDWRPFPIDVRNDESGRFERVKTNEAPFELMPGGFALASTVERLTLPPDLAARVEGKSSLGRLGLAVHITAGFIDPGFRGQVTLELHSVRDRPFLLIPGMPIAQVSFIRLSRPSIRPYGSTGGSKYQEQSGPTRSRYHLNFDQSER